MVLFLLTALLHATPAFADDPVSKGADQMTEAAAVLHTVEHVIAVGKKRILNGGKPNPPKNIYDDNNPNGIPYPYTKDKVIDIDGEKLGLCMALMTRAPYVFKKDRTVCMPIDLGKGKPRTSNPSTTVLNYLIANERSCDLTSGHELELHDWILEQPDNSIDPVMIYKKSLDLNSGNMWNALVTIHQLLRNNARWQIGNHYDYASSPELQGKFFNKFIDIRGDLSQRGPAFHGDHFGSWYRIWGAMLYRLSLLEEKEFLAGFPPKDACLLWTLATLPIAGSRAVTGLIDDWHADALFYSQEYLKIHLYEVEDDARKFNVDSAGGLAGSSLVRGLWDPNLADKNSLTAEKCLNQRPYLNEK